MHLTGGVTGATARHCLVGVAGLLPFAGMLGGLWGSEALVAGLAMGVAMAFLLCPPRRGVLGGVRWLLLLLAVAPAFALLPSWLGGTVWWREILFSHYPEAAVSTISPQPKMIWQAYPLHLVLLAWVWWACGRSQLGETRVLHKIGWMVAVIISLGLCGTKWVSGFWDGPHREVLEALLGTRNQAGAIAAVALVASTGAAISSRHAGWLLGAIPAVTALLVLGSRGAAIAGILGVLVTAGVAVWKNESPRRWRLIGTSLVVVIGLLVAAGLAMPSQTLPKRLWHSPVSGIVERIAVQADAWALLANYPLTGCGRGSFVVVFPFHRDFSILTAQPGVNWHPESDWLLLACEMGAPAGILVVVLLLWMVARWVTPFRQEGTATAFGVATAVAAQGLVDIPLHAPIPFLLIVLFVSRGIGSGDRHSRLWAALFAGALMIPALSVLSTREEMPRQAGPLAEETTIQWRYPLDASAMEDRAIHLLRSGDNDGWRVLRASLLLRPYNIAAFQRAVQLAQSLDRGDLAQEFEAMAPSNH